MFTRSHTTFGMHNFNRVLNNFHIKIEINYSKVCQCTNHPFTLVIVVFASHVIAIVRVFFFQFSLKLKFQCKMRCVDQMWWIFWLRIIGDVCDFSRECVILWSRVCGNIVIIIYPFFPLNNVKQFQACFHSARMKTCLKLLSVMIFLSQCDDRMDLDFYK